MQTSAEKLCSQIRQEIQQNKRHHLKLAVLLLKLRVECSSEKDFFLLCEDQFGLAERTTYQYLEVAQKKHVHALNLEFSKLYLLSKFQEDKLKVFLKRVPVQKIQKMSVRELSLTIAEQKPVKQEKPNPKGREKLRLVVNNDDNDSAQTISNTENNICDRIESTLSELQQAGPLSEAARKRLEKIQQQISELISPEVRDYLTQNRKMEKMSGRPTFNWAIPSDQTIDGIKTCPNAATCAKGCYAVTGLYRLPRNKRISEERFRLSLSKTFVRVISDEIKRRNVLRLRIHDSGDFYNEDYLEKWIAIANANPNTEFYTYTKMIGLLKRYDNAGKIPSNFKVVYSFGGKEDRLIDVKKDLHSYVFESQQKLQEAGYLDAHNDDAVVLMSACGNKIGLVHHGTVNYKNSNWNKGKRKAA